jgi:SPOR domain/PilZ domain
MQRRDAERALRAMAAAMNATERRRATPRMTCFGDIHFEPNNGGIVLNVSEGGLCFHSIAPVQRDGPIRFWFSLDRQRIQASGEFVWMDHTQQTGGLRFTALPAVGREVIRNRTREAITPTIGDEESRPSQLALRSYLGLSTTHEAPLSETAGSTELAVVSAAPTGIMRWRSWSSFSGGLALGILASVLTMMTVMFVANRQQFGRSIIWVGERVAAKPQAQVETAAEIPPATAHVAPVITTPVEAATTATELPTVAAAKPAPGPMSAPLTTPSQNQRPPAIAAASVTPREVPAPADVKAPAAEPATAKPRVAAVVRPKLPAGGEASRAGAVAPAMSQPAMDVAANSNLVAAKALPVPPAWPMSDRASNPVVEAQQGGKEGVVQTPEMYFQVGRFKDELAAKKKTDELDLLGFPATDVERSRFWSNSYAVLVGPYAEAVDAKTARKGLVSHGYKPQPLEKGSREFTFSHVLAVNGVRLPAGTCTVRWESYGSEVNVEFVYEKEVIATVSGKWVNQAVRYDRNAFAYIRGTGSLVEIRFAGMTRTLVFGKLS